MKHDGDRAYALAVMEEGDEFDTDSVPTVAVNPPPDSLAAPRRGGSAWLPRLTLQQSSVSLDSTRAFRQVPALQSIHESEPRCSESAAPIPSERLQMYRKSWVKVANEGAMSEYSADEPAGPEVVYYDALKEYRADNDRAWHIDWMRFVANWLVVAVHIIEAVTNLELKATPPEISTMRSFLVNLLQIGMPIFFYASGRAAAYSSERNILTFAWKKTKRLILPLIVGYLVIVMLSAYVSGPFYTCRTDSMPKWNLFKFMGWFYANFSGCGFEWLWFLPSLWGLGVGSFPLTLFVWTWQLAYTPVHCLSEKDRKMRARLFDKLATPNTSGGAGISREPTNAEKIKVLRNSSVFFVVFTAVVIIVLFGFFVPIVGLPASHVMLYCLPFILAALVPIAIAPVCRKINWRLPLFLWLPLGTIWLAALREKSVEAIEAKGVMDDFVAREATSMAFYCCFYLQGYIEQRYMFEWERYERLAMETGGHSIINFMTRPFKVIIWVALMANGMPGLSEHWAYLWTYPVYNEVYASVSYVLGSWIGLHFWERFMMMYCRSSFGALYHKHITQASMVVYIVHGLSIAIIGRILVYPLRNSLRRIGGVLVYSFLVPPLTMVFYFLIINVPPLASGFGLGDGNWAWSEWGRPGRDCMRWITEHWGHPSSTDDQVDLKRSEDRRKSSSSSGASEV